MPYQGIEGETDPGKALYLPDGTAVRQMRVGTNWTVINLGARFRQSKVSAWSSPEILTGTRTVGFGLCSGTSNPYSSSAPFRVLAVRTASPWTRLSGRSWWTTGWELFEVGADGEVQHGSGSGATLRVSLESEAEASAWYTRFTKTGAGSVRVDLFLPTSASAPTEEDFKTQLARARFTQYVSNHQSYVQTTLNLEVDPLMLNSLDSVNIFSNITNYVSTELRGIEFLGIRSVRMS